jgi:hypothetical protein
MINAPELSVKIVKHIMAHPGVTYDELEGRARLKGIDLNIFEQAMEAIHRFNKIERRSSVAGQITYFEKKEKPPDDALTRRQKWIDENYPVMDETNNGQHEIFEGVDMSYLFMKPDDAKEWWAKKKYRPWELSRK